jgi:secreted Zn-dependent insulinase-like peptidase
MTLTILGKQEMKDLESMVVPLFEKLVNRNATLVSWPDDENPPYNKSETGVKIEILAKNALQYLSLEFSIPKDTVDIFVRLLTLVISHSLLCNTKILGFCENCKRSA